MRYVETEGLRVSAIGLGTWQFGSREWGYGAAYASDIAPALVRRAVELGITLIDTAEVYGPGHSERIIGATLAAMPAAERARLVVATKFLPIVPAEPILARQAAGSRRRLGVDAIDLYYAHWPNPFVSVRRVMQAVRPLVAIGARAARRGEQLLAGAVARRGARASGPRSSRTRSGSASSVPGRPGTLVPYAAAENRLVVAYSPLGQGLLTGAAAAGPVRGMRAMNPLSRAGGKRRRWPRCSRRSIDIAAAHDATAAQIALAWVLHHPNTVAIPGARTVEQLEENAAAADLVLSDAEFARLSVEAEAVTQS